MSTYNLTVTRDSIASIGRDYTLFGEPLLNHVEALITTALTSRCSKLTLVDRGSFNFTAAAMDEADELIFASPMAFTLPDNLLFDSAASVAAKTGPVVVHGATAVNSADAIIVGTYKEPVAIFIKGDIYRSLIDSEPEYLSQISEKILIEYSTSGKNGKVQGSQANKALRVRSVSCGEPINSRRSFFSAVASYRHYRLNCLIDDGVHIPCKNGVTIAPGAVIGAETVIGANVTISKNVVIGESCVITAGSFIGDSTIGDNCLINSSYVENAVIESGTQTKPRSVITG